MAPLVLRTTDGADIPLTSQNPLWGVSRAEQKQDLLTGDTLSVSIESTSPISIQIGQTVPVFGQLYTLNTLPTVTKTGNNRYEYEALLEGPQYHLLRVVFFDTDVNGNALSSVFSLTGNLQFFAEVLFSNMARVFSGAWGLGTVSVPGESTQSGGAGTAIPGDQTETKTLSFENENCLSVLQRLCAEWGTEFSIEYRANDAPNRILTIGPAGQTLSDQFSYGQGNGLYKLSRQSVQGTQFFTKAYIFGGSKNIPVGYRGFATRLQLPGPAVPAGSNPSPWDSFVQDSAGIATYGLIEGTKVFDDIYPHRTGTVTEVVDQLSFTDVDVDFDPFAYDETEVVAGNVRPIFKYQIKGLAPKVSFLTGQLAGYSFDLIKFFTNNYILQLKSYTDDNGLVFPSPDPASPFRIQPGDTYTFVDMKMPDEYVTAAENKLLAAGQAWLAENGTPSVEYSLELDELYLQSKANDTGIIPIDSPPNFFVTGDAIRLIDTDLSIDKLARITGFTRDVLRPYKYTLTLGDTRKISRLQRILAQQTSVRDLIRTKIEEPAAGTEPQVVKSQIQDIKNTLITHGNAITLTLSASPIPSGFMPTGGSKTPGRHELYVDVWQGVIGNLNRKKIGLVEAIGRKRPFR
jgi:hypothetical protein